MRFHGYLLGIGLFLGSQGGMALAQHVLPRDTIPDFCPTPTIQSVASGRWSSASTWSPARVPQSGDSVLISPGTTVTFDRRLTFALNAVGIDGTLEFDTTVSTLLWATNVQVNPDGALLIGSATQPVPASVTAEIVIANRAPTDTKQFGTGLTVLGKITLHGAIKRPTFVRVSSEPRSGQNTLTLESAVSGWLPGDRLFLPDTRHMTWEDIANWAPKASQREELTLTSVSSDGRTLTLSRALQFNHLGARDGNGQLDFLPHVGNLSRNVIVRSEAGFGQSGTPGHVMLTHRADVDIRYALFRELGRTTIQDLNDSTNHIGRYALHVHHVMGPRTTPANGHQFTLVGNAIDGGSASHQRKWGLVVHNSHYGLIKDNVIYNFAGACVMFEDGSESFNTLDHNFASRSHGAGNNISEGTAGTGFWFKGPNNYVRNNVASDIWSSQPEAGYGFKIFMRYLGNVMVPNFKGADTSVSGQFTVRDANKMPVLEFSNNEVYCSAQGLTYWWVNSFDVTWNPSGEETVFRDLSVWHVYNVGVYHYQSAHITFDRLVMRGQHSGNAACCGVGFLAGDYTVGELVFRNIDMQGMKTGIRPSTGSYTTQVIENSYMRNEVDIEPVTLYNVNGGSWLPPRHIIIRNVRFDAWPGSAHQAISMAWNPTSSSVYNTTQLDEVLVYQFQGNANDNFRAYYTVQATQNVAGGRAPCTTTRPEVEGLVCPISSDPTPPPVVDNVAPAAPTNLRVLAR